MLPPPLRCGAEEGKLSLSAEDGETLATARVRAFSVFSVTRLMKVPSGGPPVPALGANGSLAYGQPNWSMKPGITR